MAKLSDLGRKCRDARLLYESTSKEWVTLFNRSNREAIGGWRQQPSHQLPIVQAEQAAYKRFQEAKAAWLKARDRLVNAAEDGRA